MINSIKGKIRSYIQGNHAKHAELVKYPSEEIQAEFGIKPLPEELETKYKEGSVGDGYVLVICNDDLTPISFVIVVLSVCLGHTQENAFELALKVHNAKHAQVATGSEEVLRSVENFIVANARENNFPLKFRIEKI